MISEHQEAGPRLHVAQWKSLAAHRMLTFQHCVLGLKKKATFRKQWEKAFQEKQISSAMQ